MVRSAYKARSMLPSEFSGALCLAACCYRGGIRRCCRRRRQRLVLLPLLPQPRRLLLGPERGAFIEVHAWK